MIEIQFAERVLEEGLNKIERSFSDACDWLASLGVFPPSNRFRSYQKLFNDFRVKRGEIINSEGMNLFSNALGEAMELIRIRRSLESVDSNSYISQLTKMTSGKAFKNVIEHDPARDFSFELSIAARFLSAGYEVDVTSLADAVVKVGTFKIYVECKRIQSPKKIYTRLSEAEAQLSRRVEASKSSKARGIVALKVTEVLNPDARHEVLPSMERFLNDSKANLHGYIRENETEFKRRIGRKQLGVFFENSLNGILYNPGTASIPKFVNCRGAAILHKHDQSTTDHGLLSEIAPKLTSQIEL